MIKLSVEELDALVKGAAVVETPKIVEGENAEQTGASSTKEPILRKPIDSLVSAANMVGAGAVGAAAGFSKLKTNMPLKEVE